MAGTLREVILQRIQRTVSRETEDDDLPDELELKSDEELLAWYDRFQELSLVRCRFSCIRHGVGSCERFRRQEVTR